jgi:hypothetical protein
MALILQVVCRNCAEAPEKGSYSAEQRQEIRPGSGVFYGKLLILLALIAFTHALNIFFCCQRNVPVFFRNVYTVALVQPVPAQMKRAGKAVRVMRRQNFLTEI